MHITFLGTGTGIPTPERNSSGIYLDYKGERFIWDCGEGTLMQILKSGLNFMKIDRIFITHFHADHFIGIMGLIQSMSLEGREKPLHVYGPEASRFVADMLDMGYWSGGGFEVKAHDTDFETGSKKIIDEDEYEIWTIPTEHSVPSNGYFFKEKKRTHINMEKVKDMGLEKGPKIGELRKKGKVTVDGKEIKLEDVSEEKEGVRVAYSGDTKASETFFEEVKGADLLIHEATFMEEAQHDHSSIPEVCKLAKTYDIKKLILTHISRRYDKESEKLEKEAKKHYKNAEVAKDFMEIEV